MMNKFLSLKPQKKNIDLKYQYPAKRRLNLSLNVKIGLGFSCSLMMILPLLLFLNWYERSNDWRLIYVSLPPLEYTSLLQYGIKPIGYGNLGIIVDGNDNFYLHFRDNYTWGTLDSNNREIELESGLNASCLFHVNRKMLSEIILKYQKENDDYAISFSFSNNAKFLDIILMFDLMESHLVKKYALLKLRKEEKNALMDKKRR